MSQLILPHSIDAGTAAVANEVQQNFTTTRDIINGEIEGGGGSGNNMKANGVTAREILDAILVAGLPPHGSREGLVTQPTGTTQALFVTPGANRDLNYGAGTVWIKDDSGMFAAGALIPVTVNSGTVSVPANASGNPRLDQVILTMTGYNTGTVSILQGTPNAATTINTRTGAATIPDNAIRIADVLTTNGFAGPYVNHTSLRNRLVWAVPMRFELSSTASPFEHVVGRLEEEDIDYRFTLENSGHASLTYNLGNNGAGVWSQIIREDQVLTTSALAGFTRGGAGASIAVLALVATAPGSGGHRFTGWFRQSMTPQTDTIGGGVAYQNDGVHSDGSVTGGGANHRLSHMGVSNVISGLNATTSDVSWATIAWTAGNVTGYIIIDRVPTKFPTA